MVNLNQRHPIESIGILILVILFHIFGILGLLFLMHSNKKEDMPAPLEIRVVDVSSAASSASAQVSQPPAPEMIVPPPPEIEPPPINTEAPVQPKPPKIVKKQVKKREPAAQPAKSSASDSQNQGNMNGTSGEGMSNTPNDGPPDRSAGSRALNGVKMNYPPDMEAAGKEGRVILSCDIEADGHTKNCNVIEAKGGNSFKEEALRYVASARYRPATRNGMPVKEKNHRLTISFKLGAG